VVACLTPESVPPERVFRKAGLLPPRVIGNAYFEERDELMDYFEALEPQQRETALRIIRTLYEQQEE